MLESRKIFVTTETFETVRLNMRMHQLAHGQCEVCAARVEIVTLEQAAWLMGIGTREMLRRVDQGSVHATETESGLFLICRNSLQREKAVGNEI